MKIRHINIQRFRGIKELDWTVNGEFICLIGPGDSTKSAILDAIECALSPRWNLSFDDTDFYNADSSEPLIITVTAGELPDTLIKESKFGLDCRGWSMTEGPHDEPQEGDDLVLSIQLRVDSSLEPTWAVVNDRNPEGHHISAQNRELIGIGRLGAFVDWHLGWSRGSALSRLTGDTDAIASLLVEAGRTARKALSNEDLSRFHEIAKRAMGLGKEVGVTPKNEYQARLDTQAVNIGLGGITLHDGEVPVRRAGLGTRRLLSLALKKELSMQGGITLIDEVEHALEPHRIRRLLQFLRSKNAAGTSGQILMTTHSSVVVVSLEVDQLKIVRSNNGITTITSIQHDLQNIIRRYPEALLGRKVLVCEGKTELGICSTLDEWWADKHGMPPFAYFGVIPICGSGSEFPKIAQKFSALGYKVAIFGDSDCPLDPHPSILRNIGIEIIQWEGSMSTEERLCNDLPWAGIDAMLEIAINEKGLQSVRDTVASHLGLNGGNAIDDDFRKWRSDDNEDDLRSAIGKAAKNGDWFKRPDLGMELGSVISKYWNSIPETDLIKKIKSIREWAERDD